ncbi:hypothetical protein MUTS15_55840 [Escherichia coli]|nr:hypothetical protein MUTS15_55840 [Escherichia coli]BDZ05471.1 hypothetical protein MUTS16_65440 [Escherichia coli]
MERNKLARQIIDTCLEMTRLGLNQGTAGNVSVRYQDGMLITPTGIPYEKLTESHIVFIDGNGKHEEGKLPQASGVSIWRPIKADRMPTRLFTIMPFIVRQFPFLTDRSPRFTT